VIQTLLSKMKDDDARVEALFLATLGRAPSRAEAKKMLDHVRSEKSSPKAWEDVLFALMATTEFATNH
jgi:hypothetical protein